MKNILSELNMIIYKTQLLEDYIEDIIKNSKVVWFMLVRYRLQFLFYPSILLLPVQSY